jgi:replicative DNA helicase
MTTRAAEALSLINHSAEIQAIGAMLQNSQAARALIDALDPQDFYDERRQILFEALANLYRGIEPITPEALVAESRHVRKERQSDEEITAAHIESFAGDPEQAEGNAVAIKRLAWLRQAGDYAWWLVESLQSNPDPNALFVEAQEKWQHLQPSQATSRFVYGWDTVNLQQDAIRQRINEYNAGRGNPLNWPWQSWNQAIRPLRPGMVGTLSMADGQGKSTYLEMIAEHWAMLGQHVVVVHLEDSLDYKLDRRDARYAKVPLANIEDGNLSPAQTHQIAGAHKGVQEWAGNLHYYDAAGESMPTIVRELESRVAEGVCQAVVFDYLDKVQATRGQSQLYGNNTWERQANDMELLKTFAEKSKVPVFTATQGNKAMQNGGIQTRQNIQGSGQKSQKSQLVIIGTRDIVGEMGLADSTGATIAEEGEYSPIIKLRVDKQNRGKTGVTLNQFLMGEFFLIRDIEIKKTHLN